MHGLIGQKRLFSRLFDICEQNCNMENVHSTTRNIYCHWKTSFTELIAIFINSKFVSFCLCWLEGFTHLVCRFFHCIKKITIEVTAGAPSLPMHFDEFIGENQQGIASFSRKVCIVLEEQYAWLITSHPQSLKYLKENGRSLSCPRGYGGGKGVETIKIHR